MVFIKYWLLAHHFTGMQTQYQTQEQIQGAGYLVSMLILSSSEAKMCTSRRPTLAVRNSFLMVTPGPWHPSHRGGLCPPPLDPVGFRDCSRVEYGGSDTTVSESEP